MATATATATATANHQSEKGKSVKLNLKSSDGKQFPVNRPAALLSATLKNRIEFEDEEEIDVPVGSVNVPVERVTIPVPEVDGETLAAVTVYLNTHAGDGTMSDAEFLADKDIQALKKLVVAADKLGIPGLYEIVIEKTVRIIESKSLNWIREALGAVDDYTPEEKEELRLQNWWVDWAAEDERVGAENEIKGRD